MIKKINRKKYLITPEKASSFIPVFISSVFSLLLIIFLVIPEYVKSNKVNLELNGLVKKKNELDDLKLQYKIINQKFEKLTNEKSRIVELISGTSNLDTFLAKLGEIGKNNNIEFVSIVPKKVMLFVDKTPDQNNKQNNKKVNINIDPLFVEGTKKYIIDFTFKTEFVNLLSFLRELEFQENLILLDNINIKLIGQNNNDREILDSNKILEVKLSMTSYGKI